MHSVTRTIFPVFAFIVMNGVVLLTWFCKLLIRVAILSGGGGTCLKCLNGTTPLFAAVCSFLQGLQGPGCRYRQPAVSGWACCISFLQRLPTATVAACGPVLSDDATKTMLSLPVAWTIVMLCFLASRTNCCVACSPFRTLPPGW